MKANANPGQSVIGIIIVLVLVGLLGGGVYYYSSRQTSEAPETPEKPAGENVAEPEEEVIPLPKDEGEIGKPEIAKPSVEITARPAEISDKNSPISAIFGITIALAQEFKTGKELQVEIREAPPEEIDSFQTWTAGYAIKNTTDSSFILAYDIAPDEYKTSGAVVVDPDGGGPGEWFYHTFGEEVSLPPKSEQYLDISLLPPEGLTQITPRMVFKGFSTQEPLFTHEFTVQVTHIPPPAECETPICPEGEVLYWRGAVDNFKCPMLDCVLPEIVGSEPCGSTTITAEGQRIVTECEHCAIISAKGVCAESVSNQCTDKLPPEGWSMVDTCPD